MVVFLTLNLFFGRNYNESKVDELLLLRRVGALQISVLTVLSSAIYRPNG